MERIKYAFIVAQQKLKEKKMKKIFYVNIISLAMK
jgi:hypothetical protein